jgi:hypothetical protein
MKTGTVDLKTRSESLSRIQILTNLYKRQKLTTEQYIKEMHCSMSGLTTDRDYNEYLYNIGQK